MIELKWSKAIENGVSNFRGDLMRFPERLSYNSSYYISSYGCPSCASQPLYKLRVRGAVTTFQGNLLQAFNLFTCSRCKIFLCSLSQSGEVNNFTSIPLSSYALITSPASTESGYMKFLTYTNQFKNEGNGEVFLIPIPIKDMK